MAGAESYYFITERTSSHCALLQLSPSTVWRLRARAHWGLVRVFGRSRLNDASTQTAPAQWSEINSEVAFYVYKYQGQQVVEFLTRLYKIEILIFHCHGESQILEVSSMWRYSHLIGIAISKIQNFSIGTFILLAKSS